jgi:hypothetical protein
VPKLAEFLRIASVQQGLDFGKDLRRNDSTLFLSK